MSLGGRRDALSLEFKNDTLDTSSEADAWRVLTTQQFGQPIIATAAVERLLIDIRGELEDRARIIVQATHQQWIERKWHAIAVQEAFDRCEVFAARLAEIIDKFWRTRDFGLILWLFAVEQA